jgi:hypothetical protein
MPSNRLQILKQRLRRSDPSYSPSRHPGFAIWLKINVLNAFDDRLTESTNLVSSPKARERYALTV